MHVSAMHLVREHRRGKARAERGMERTPPPDHLSDWLVTPETETERPRRDSRDHAVPLRPLDQLETRDSGVAGRHFGQ
jgi:hypothetical protein